jgi:hypothetical protein
VKQIVQIPYSSIVKEKMLLLLQMGTLYVIILGVIIILGGFDVEIMFLFLAGMAGYVLLFSLLFPSDYITSIESSETEIKIVWYRRWIRHEIRCRKILITLSGEKDLGKDRSTFNLDVNDSDKTIRIKQGSSKFWKNEMLTDLRKALLFPSTLNHDQNGID